MCSRSIPSSGFNTLHRKWAFIKRLMVCCCYIYAGISRGNGIIFFSRLKNLICQGGCLRNNLLCIKCTYAKGVYTACRVVNGVACFMRRWKTQFHTILTHYSYFLSRTIKKSEPGTGSDATTIQPTIMSRLEFSRLWDWTKVCVQKSLQKFALVSGCSY